jgi:hypothetical protein
MGVRYSFSPMSSECVEHEPHKVPENIQGRDQGISIRTKVLDAFFAMCLYVFCEPGELRVGQLHIVVATHFNRDTLHQQVQGQHHL